MCVLADIFWKWSKQKGWTFLISRDVLMLENVGKVNSHHMVLSKFCFRFTGLVQYYCVSFLTLAFPLIVFKVLVTTGVEPPTKE